MKTSEKLIQRLRETVLPNLPDGARAERTYRGRWQAEAGVFSWILFDEKGRAMSIGSEETMLECVTCRKLTTRLDPWTRILHVYAQE